MPDQYDEECLLLEQRHQRQRRNEGQVDEGVRVLRDGHGAGL